MFILNVVLRGAGQGGVRPNCEKRAFRYKESKKQQRVNGCYVLGSRPSKILREEVRGVFGFVFNSAVQ